MNQTLEHLKNPNKCFEKLNKILNKGGMLFIETPTSDFYLKNKINKSIWGGLHAPRHMYIYNTENIINLSKKFGFKVYSKKYLISPYILYETIKTKLKKRKSFFLKIFSIYNPLILTVIIISEYINIIFLKKYSNMRIILRKININYK